MKYSSIIYTPTGMKWLSNSLRPLKSVKSTVAALLLLISFLPGRAQQVLISHPGAISGEWTFSEGSGSDRVEHYSIYLTAKPESATDINSQLFISQMAGPGGIAIGARGSNLKSFYYGWVNDFDYSGFINANQARVAAGQGMINQADYFLSKYPDGNIPGSSRIRIAGYDAIVYTIDKTGDDPYDKSRRVQYYIFVFLSDQNGVSILSKVHYFDDASFAPSPYSFDQYEQMMYEHLNGLTFEMTGAETASSSPSAPASSGGEEEVPWEVVIGLIGAGGAAALGRKLFKKKPGTKQPEKKNQSKKKEQQEEEEEEEEEEEKFILNINRDQFRLKPGEPGTLEVVVYRVTPRGSEQFPADIRVTSTEKALKVKPAMGNGKLTASLLLDKEPREPEFPLEVTAEARGHLIRRNITIIADTEMKIAVETLPGNKRSLRPDTFQVLTVRAMVTGPGGKDIPELTEQIVFKPKSDWIDLSEPAPDEPCIAINMGATNPSPGSSRKLMPPSVVLTLFMDEVPEGEPPLQHDLEIRLADCRLETDLEEASFPDTGETSEITFETWIENGEEETGWNFSGEYRHGVDPTDPLTTIAITPKGETRATVTLTGPLIRLGEEEQIISKTLVLSAVQGDEEPLERHLLIMVSREGLFIKNGADKKNQISILADKPYEANLDLALYRYDKEINQISVDKEGLSAVEFELQDEEEELVNLASVLKPQFEFTGLVTNIPYGRYHFTTKEEIPGTGTIYTLHYLLKAQAGDALHPDLFEQTLTLRVKTYGIGEEFPDWVKAYEECKYIIRKYVPAGDPTVKLTDLLEMRKMTLGAEGLTELRNRIWKVASNLILAEGAEGYKSEEAWANAITVTLEWTEWAGDMAFNALAAYYLKGVGATAAGLIKAKMIEALNFYIYEPEKGWEEFKSRQIQSLVPMLMDTAKGRILSIENIEMIVGKNKPLAWTIFISCEFLYNLYQTKSVVEAAKITGRQISEELIMRKLTAELHKEALRRNIPVSTPDEVLDDMMKSVKTVNGQEVVDPQKVLEIMRDPAKVRTIEKHGTPQMKEIFERSRNKIYNEHDARLKDYISKTYHLPPDEIQIHDFRTPGKKGTSVNTDRDYRVLRKVKGADGREHWIELQRRNWQEKSYEIFGEVTDKPDGVDATEWAERHQQRATDRFDAEAGKDYSDHIYNPETGEIEISSNNITRVKEGKGTLIDAQETGRMYKTKVGNALKNGTEPEAYAQAKKAVKTLKEVREGYKKQDLKIKDLPENLQKAMKVIEDAHVDANATPDYMDMMRNKLNQLDYDNIGDVAGDMERSFGDLKEYNAPDPASGFFNK